jgi:4-amino-4-deoxy-L-arabinose transferase-like glycosyltransferase
MPCTLLNAEPDRETMASPVVSTSQSSARRGRLRSYALFTLWACLYIVPFMRLYFLGTDEGTLDYGAVRVAHGQVFARDFFEVIGPGTFYWLAVFFKLFGVSFLATRICLFLTSLGTALVMYFLSRRVCTRYQVLPSIILAGTYFCGFWPAVSHHVDSNFAALLSVACIVLWHERHSNLLLLASGALAGLTTAFHQPKGMLLLCAFIVWLCVLCWRRVTSWASLGVVTGGYLSVVGLILLYFWSKGALGSLIFVNIVWPSHHYGAVNSVSYAHSIITNYWDHWVIDKSGFRWTIPMAAILIVPLLFIATLPGLLVALGMRCKWDLQKPEILLFWLCGGAIWLAELHRMDIGHLTFGSPLLIILCIYFMAEYRGKVAGLALQTLSISATFLVFFNLCCLFVAAHPVPTRVGTVRMFQSAPALAYLQEHTTPGEEIFAYPYSPRYYFLASTTNPTPFSVLVYNYNTPSQFQEVVRILDQRKVKYVVWDSKFVKSAVDIFPTSTLLPQGGLIVEPYLESHYRVVQDFDGVRVMERVSDPNAK